MFHFNVELLKKYLRERNLSKSKFCKECGINLATYNRMVSNNNNFYMKTFVKIAKFMQVDVFELIDKTDLMKYGYISY